MEQRWKKKKKDKKLKRKIEGFKMEQNYIERTGKRERKAVKTKERTK